jgi:hypothetical protein
MNAYAFSNPLPTVMLTFFRNSGLQDEGLVKKLGLGDL